MNRLIILLLLSPLHLFAQTKISGIISDKEGKPIPGANVFIKDTYDGSSTDPDGKFSFVTDETGEQVFSASFLGFESHEQRVKLEGKEITIKISLKEKSTELNTVTI